jgi:hypothetical protein
MNPYVLTPEEKDELNSVVESLRSSADQLEKMVYIRDSIYVTGMTHHLKSIIDGYREVLRRQERTLFGLNVKFTERRLNK